METRRGLLPKIYIQTGIANPKCWINRPGDDFIVIFPDSYRGLMQHVQNRWSIKTLWHC